MRSFARLLGRGLILLLLASLGWGVWYLATHPHWGSPPEQGARPDPTIRAKRLTITGWHRRGSRAERAWQVTAHEAGQAAGGTEQWFSRITDGLLYQDGQVIARFTAGKGRGNQAANQFTIQGGARVRLERDGTTLSTEQVQWNGPLRQLRLPRPVRITRGDLTLDVASARAELGPGRLTVQRVSGQHGQMRFQAAHGLLRLADRRLELHPASLQMPAARAKARRITYLTNESRLTAQEVRMQLTISPTARAAAATGLTLALLNAVAAAPAKEGKTTTRQLEVEGERLTDNAKEMVIVSAKVTHPDPKGDTVVTAERMVIQKNEKGQAERIIATGKPKVVNNRNEVTGEQMVVIPGKRLAIVTGNFRVEVVPKPGEEQPPEEEKNTIRGQVREGVMTGDRLEYDYRNKNIAAEGNLKLVSKGRTATGKKLFYTDRTEIVEFEGPVRARDEKGNLFNTQAGLSLALNKTGISHVPGKFTATLLVEEEEEQPDDTGAETKTAAAQKPAEPAGKPASGGR